MKETNNEKDLKIKAQGRRDRKNKKRKIAVMVIGLSITLGSIAYADYYLSDGTLVQWAGDNMVKITKDGVTQTVSATPNADGRLVPNTGLTESQREETDLLGSQETGGDGRFNENTGLTVPVFTNGKFTGFANIYQDSDGLGRTFYTQNNGAGDSGSTVISGQNGGSADFNWSRIDLSTPPTSIPNNYNPVDFPGGYHPPPASPPPSINLLRSSSIEHNTAWEAVRTKNNRSSAMFYAGEKFVIKALTTPDATSVRVTFNFPQASKDISPAFQESPNQARPNFAATFQLTRQNTNDWSGTFWRKPWVGIPDGAYTAVISATFQNGQTRTATHSIQIQGSILDFANGIEKIQQ